MTGKRRYLILQSALSVLLALWLAASAVSICREGEALRAEDPMAPIYTPEKTAERFKPIAPLFFGAIGMTVAGRVLAVKEDAEMPAAPTRIKTDTASGVIPKPGARPKNRRARRVFQIAVLAAALVFILLGIVNGGAKAVHTKAANICTECVGLG